jgi:hypothetical protein
VTRPQEDGRASGGVVKGQRRFVSAGPWIKEGTMHRIRSNLTYANIMSSVAVFFVLGGGTALAAYVVSSNAQIGPNTISGHQPPAGKHANIIAGSLNGFDLANGAVGPAKLSPNAVTDGITQETAATAVNGSASKELTADCPAGTKVTGGGYVFSGVTPDDAVSAVRNYAVDADTWLVRAQVVSDPPPQWGLTVVANCAG